MLESPQKHSSKDADPISRMLGSAAPRLVRPELMDSPVPPPKTAVAAKAPAPRQTPAGEPDFTRMTPAEKVAWNLSRWNRILG